MKKILLYIAFALATLSCVYPFEIETDQVAEEALVFDGDIILGGLCTIKVSNMTGFGKAADSDSEPGNWQMTVYCSDGTIYQGVRILDGGETASYRFDFTEAPVDKQYRLIYDPALPYKGEYKIYSTPWMDVSIAPIPDEITLDYDDNDIYIGLKLKGAADSGRYYRWNYDEVYEFHADFMPDYYLNFDVDLDRRLSYLEREVPVDPKYYCWAKSNSRESTLVSTENLSENTIANQVFRTIPRTSKRIMEMYRIDVRMKGISRDGYYFHKTLQANSNTGGSLFAPTPSEMRGNVVCEQDPSELVLGYVDVITESVVTKYIDNSYSMWRRPLDNLFIPEFNFNPDDPEAEGFTPLQWYNMGYAPAIIPPDSDTVNWALKRCIDCTLEGGSKEKPAGWPTTHE